MKIGTVDLGERPLLLAPMEDVTDAAFRLLCRRFGADMVYTEFLSADALIRQVAGTTRKLEISAEERPVAIQIYGREVEPMVEAARIAETAGPEVLDLNFGCPVKRVAGKGAGSGMLRCPDVMLRIVSEIVKAVKIPVTVKTRLAGTTIVRSSSSSPKPSRTWASKPSPSTAVPAPRCTPALPTGRSSAR